jgi:hypothetical protein
MQNSMVAPMAVANALLNGVAAARGSSALERFSRHDRLMNRWARSCSNSMAPTERPAVLRAGLIAP